MNKLLFHPCLVRNTLNGAGIRSQSVRVATRPQIGLAAEKTVFLSIIFWVRFFHACSEPASSLKILSKAGITLVKPAIQT